MALESFPSDDITTYLEAFRGQDHELVFPSLSPEQLRFGVNPSYAEFNANVFGSEPSTEEEGKLNK